MQPPRHSAPIDDDAWQPEPEWQWSKARNFGISIAIWPIEWRLGRIVWSDAYAWVGTLHLGPIQLQLNVNVGA